MNCNLCNFRYIYSTLVTVTKLLSKSNFPSPEKLGNKSILNQSVIPLRSGRISEMTLDEVRKLDIAEKHVLKDEFSPTRVPRLDDFIRECLRLNLKMIIDLKTYKSPEATARVILELFSKYPELHTKAMVSSFFPHLIYVIRFENYSSFLTKDLYP